MIEPTPPIKTAGTAPVSAAIPPALNSPISFEAPVKIEFTAFTLPRIISGVANCINETRIFTLTMSAAPTTNMAVKDNQKVSEKPNTIVASPKIITDT